MSQFSAGSVRMREQTNESVDPLLHSTSLSLSAQTFDSHSLGLFCTPPPISLFFPHSGNWNIEGKV